MNTPLSSSTSKNSSLSITSICTTALSTLLLTACASTPPPVTSSPVIQRPNQTYETTGTGSSKVKAKTVALNSATLTCKGKSPIVIADELQYNGVLNEQFGRMVEQTTKAATSIIGAKSPDLSRDDTYEYTISFKCE